VRILSFDDIDLIGILAEGKKTTSTWFVQRILIAWSESDTPKVGKHIDKRIPLANQD
jgi:hypothetical protein